MAETLGVVSILGLGLIGSSLGLALQATAAAHEIRGWDACPGTTDLAATMGAVTHPAPDLTTAIDGADLVVLAVPVGAVVPLVSRVVCHLPRGGVITDVASTKARIVDRSAEIAGGAFVGGHPIAGRQFSGPRAASADLFAGAAWIITPHPDSCERSTETVQRLAAGAGAIPVLMSAEEHDRTVAFVSHVPHALAYALVAACRDALCPDAIRVGGGSFRDATRVAHSSPEFWSEILADNRAHVREALRIVCAHLDDLSVALELGDAESIAPLLRQGRLEEPGTA